MTAVHIPRDDALRRCALVLHAALPADREWLLSRLPAQHGPALRQLLGELVALGLPRDQAVMDAALASVPARQQARTAEDEERRALRCASPRQIAAVLRDEAPAAVAHVLRAGPLPVRAVLARLPERQRRSVRRALDRVPARAAPALAAALLHALAARLAACPEASSAPGVRLRRWWTTWCGPAARKDRSHDRP